MSAPIIAECVSPLLLLKIKLQVLCNKILFSYGSSQPDQTNWEHTRKAKKSKESLRSHKFEMSSFSTGVVFLKRQKKRQSSNLEEKVKGLMKHRWSRPPAESTLIRQLVNIWHLTFWDSGAGNVTFSPYAQFGIQHVFKQKQLGFYCFQEWRH